MYTSYVTYMDIKSKPISEIVNSDQFFDVRFALISYYFDLSVRCAKLRNISSTLEYCQKDLLKTKKLLTDVFGVSEEWLDQKAEEYYPIETESQSI